MSLESVQLDHRSLQIPNLLCERVVCESFKSLVEQT